MDNSYEAGYRAGFEDARSKTAAAGPLEYELARQFLEDSMDVGELVDPELVEIVRITDNPDHPDLDPEFAYVAEYNIPWVGDLPPEASEWEGFDQYYQPSDAPADPMEQADQELGDPNP